MKVAIVLFSIVAACSASGLGLGLAQVGIARIHDDGQWRPALDGSVIGSGAIQWLGADLDDGQWRPHLDNSLAGVSPLSSLLLRHRRSVGLINPNSLPVPLDEVHTAALKTAQIIQQNSEGARNILGGGVPLNLPADTHEVAAGKQAHAIADLRQRAIINSVRLATPRVAAIAAPAIAAAPALSVAIAPAVAAARTVAVAPAIASASGLALSSGLAVAPVARTVAVAPALAAINGIGVAGIGASWGSAAIAAPAIAAPWSSAAIAAPAAVAAPWGVSAGLRGHW